MIYCNKNIIKSVNCPQMTDSKGVPMTCADLSQPAQSDECEENDEECLIERHPASEGANCISTAKLCTVEHETIVQCEKSTSGSTYLRTYQCIKAKDGRLFYQQISSSKCYDGYGVCSPEGECQEPVRCEGDNSAHCEGNIVYKCNKNRLLTADCNVYSTPRVCEMIEGRAQCVAKKNQCSVEGEEKITGCNAKTGKELYAICTQSESGAMYYQQAGSRLCLNGCNADNSACAPETCTEIGSVRQKCQLHGTMNTYIDTYTCTEQNGKKLFQLTSSEKCDDGKGTCSEDGQCIPAETCSPQDFVSSCENGTAVYCLLKKVRYNHCELSTIQRFCIEVDEKADCYSESDLCENEGEEIVARCNASSGKEILKKCTKGNEDMLVYVSAGSRACPNGCTPDGTKCAE